MFTDSDPVADRSSRILALARSHGLSSYDAATMLARAEVTSHGRMRLRRFSASSYGTTQIGELQARSCTMAGTSASRGSPARRASRVLQRGVGFSSTRT